MFPTKCADTTAKQHVTFAIDELPQGRQMRARGGRRRPFEDESTERGEDDGLARALEARERERILGERWDRSVDRGDGAAGLVREVREVAYDTVRLSAERGEERLSDTHPAVAERLVRGVVHHGEPMERDIRLDVRPLDVDEGAHDSVVAPRVDSCEASQARATQDPIEHGLSLIVAGVTDRDRGRAGWLGRPEERGVTRVPGARLHRVALRDLHAERHEVEAQARGEFAHGTHFIRGFGAKTVVYGRHDEPEREVWRECVQHMHERDRVGSTRACDEDALTTREESAVADGREHARAQDRLRTRRRAA